MILLIYFWLCWVFVAAQAFCLAAVSRLNSLVVVHGFLTVVASPVAEHRLMGDGITNLESILKSGDVTLPTKVHLVKAMVFPMVM